MEKKRVLVLSPHPDDETLGVGGAIAKFSARGDVVTVLTVAGHRPPLYTEAEYQKTVTEAKLAHQILGVTESLFLDIPATTIGAMPCHEFYQKITAVVSAVKPHFVLLPYLDGHIDHRYVFEAGMIATRPITFGRDIEIVAAYETLSSTHWNAPHIEPNFTPNWVINVTEYMNKKQKALECYASQIPPFPGPRSVEAIEALAKFRGTQAGFAYGEALQVIRMSWMEP